MKKYLLFVVFGLIISVMAFGKENNEFTAKRKWPGHFEINCSLSGGMRRIEYNKPLLTYVVTEPKKSNEAMIVSASLSSFVEIQRKTELSQKQEERLRAWVEKHNIRAVKPVSRSTDNFDSQRYANDLMVYSDSKEYKIDHDAIESSPGLRAGLDELIEMAKEFTETKD